MNQYRKYKYLKVQTCVVHSAINFEVELEHGACRISLQKYIVVLIKVKKKDTGNEGLRDFLHCYNAMEKYKKAKLIYQKIEKEFKKFGRNQRPSFQGQTAVVEP